MSDHDWQAATSRRLFLGAAIGGGLLGRSALPAAAHSYARHGLFIGHLWSPPTADRDLPVYGPLLNRNAVADALIEVRCAQAKGVRFERVADGATTVFQEIALAPGKPTTLAAWTTRIVLIGLAQPAKAGTSIPLTLVFRHAGTFAVTTMVEAAPDH